MYYLPIDQSIISASGDGLNTSVGVFGILASYLKFTSRTTTTTACPNVLTLEEPCWSECWRYPRA